jgi:hypothetical protein
VTEILEIWDPELLEFLKERKLLELHVGFRCIRLFLWCIPWPCFVLRRMCLLHYALLDLLTFCVVVPPLRQVLRLWDFLFAAGFHLNPLVVTALLCAQRTELLSSPQCAARSSCVSIVSEHGVVCRPMDILREIKDFDAAAIVAEVRKMIPLLPEELFARIVSHTTVPA